MKTPNLTSSRILPFTALLGAFEVLLLWYWVSLRLGQVLLYGAILTPFTAYAGKTALLAMSERRLAAPVKK
jgi:oligosaccharyltransferase complex subunit delta (ribophorin II)